MPQYIARLSIAWTLLTVACSGSSISDVDAGRDASVDAARAVDDAPSAPDAPDAPDATGIDDAAMPDSGLDASEVGVDAALNPCEMAGDVCVVMMPGACSAPNTPDLRLACPAGRECCVPAAGGPVTCAMAGGTCVVGSPTACPPPDHVGEPELYTCASPSDWCCLPPPPPGP